MDLVDGDGLLEIYRWFKSMLEGGSQSISGTVPTDAGKAASIATTNFGKLVQRIVQSNSGRQRALSACSAALDRFPPVGTGGSWEIYHAKAKEARQAGNFRSAESLFLKAISESQSFKSDDPRRYQSLDSTAVFYFALGRFEQCEIFAQRSLETANYVYGIDSKQAADARAFLANVFFKQGRFEEAKKYAREAAEILEKRFGAHSDHLATALFNLGIIQHSCCEFAQAQELYRRAFEIRKSIFGPKHETTRKVSDFYRELLLDQEAHEEARAMVNQLIGS